MANVFSNPSGGSSVSPPSAYRSRTRAKHARRIGFDRVLEDGGVGGAGVFDVDVDVAGRAARDRR